MLVVVDLGNTRLKLGVFADGRLVAEEAFLAGCRIAEGAIPFPQLFTADEVVIGSSCPEQLRVLLAAIRRPARVLDHRVVAAVPTTYIRPEELGIDRLAAAWGAREVVGGAPVVVADVGTAVTVDALDAAGRFVAVAIAPGPRSAMEGLRAAAPHLPLPPRPGPARVPADGTGQSLCNGHLLGAAGALERLVEETRAHVGAAAPLVLTGGAAGRLAPYVRIAHVVRGDVVLHGLRRLHEAVPA